MHNSYCTIVSSLKDYLPSPKDSLIWIVAIILNNLVFHLDQISNSVTWDISTQHQVGFLLAGLWSWCMLQKESWRDSIRFWSLWLLMNPFQGGLLDDLLIWHVSPWIASLIASILSLGLMQKLYLLRHTLYTHKIYLLSFVIAYIILIRLVYLGLPELIFEEAYYWNYAQHLDYGYLDHPLVTALIIKFFTVLLGNHEFSIRIGAFLCWFITGYYVYQLTKSSINVSQALLALLLATILPAYYFFGFFMSPDAPLTACWAAALYFMYRIISKQEALAWYPLAISIGIGMSSKYTIALLGFAFLILILSDKTLRVWLLRKEPYLALLIVMILFSPVILWNAAHDWASFSFQSEERAKSGAVFSTPRFISNILIFASPAGVLTLIAVLFKRKTINSQLSQIFALEEIKIKRLWQLTWLGLFPICVFALLSITRTSKLNWTGPCWLALLPLFSLFMHQSVMPSGILRLSQKLWPIMIGLLLFCYGYGMQYLSIGYPGMGYPQNMHLLGWKEVGRTIEKIAQIESLHSGKQVLVVGMDRNRIASGLAFYRGLAESNMGNQTAAAYSTTSQNLFEQNGLMFAWWFPNAVQSGKTLLLVSDTEKNLNTDRVIKHTQSMSSVHTITVLKNNHPTGSLYYRFAYGYQP